jgi:hypothetical protein
MTTRVPRQVRKVDDVEGVAAVIPQIQDVDDAAYTLAHSFPGGVPALAQRMGMPHNTLQAKVNLNLSTHKLSLRESVQMQAVAGDCRVLYAMAAALDHVALPAPALVERADAIQVLTRLGEEVGDVFGAVRKALTDGKVTPNERRQVAQQVAEAMGAMAMVMRAL